MCVFVCIYFCMYVYIYIYIYISTVPGNRSDGARKLGWDWFTMVRPWQTASIGMVRLRSAPIGSIDSVEFIFVMANARQRTIIDAAVQAPPLGSFVDWEVGGVRLETSSRLFGSTQMYHGPQLTGIVICVKAWNTGVSSNSRFQTVLIQQYSADLSFVCLPTVSDGGWSQPRAFGKQWTSGISRIRFIHSSNRIPGASNIVLWLFLVV